MVRRRFETAMLTAFNSGTRRRYTFEARREASVRIGGDGITPEPAAGAAVHSLLVKKDYFGDEVAATYDRGPMFSPEVLGPTVDFLAALAGEGAALEFGIGTGRVALPLAQRGVRVHGIDLSPAMVAKLREKA